MTNLGRLKLELSNKDYYTDDEYSVFLNENNLVPANNYIKADNEINLLATVVCILETLSNDVDLMRKIDSKEITSIDQAYKYLAQRITSLKGRVIEIQESKEENYSNIRPIFFTR